MAVTYRISSTLADFAELKNKMDKRLSEAKKNKESYSTVVVERFNEGNIESLEYTYTFNAVKER